MSKAVGKFLRSMGEGYGHWCPGCNEWHYIPTKKATRPNWSFNDDFDAPTFSPSVKITTRGEPVEICHYILTKGRIQFVGDSTHHLSGQTVDLPEYPHFEAHAPGCIVAIGADLDELVEFADAACAETTHNLGFDAALAREHFKEYIDHPETDVIIARHNEQLAGLVMIAESTEFHPKPLCYVSKFWVSPEARGTETARNLVRAVIEWANERGCSHTFATATAGLDVTQQQLFINLLSRHDFEPVGPVLCLEMKS